VRCVRLPDWRLAGFTITSLNRLILDGTCIAIMDQWTVCSELRSLRCRAPRNGNSVSIGLIQQIQASRRIRA
jgi:hypothetical protein